MEQELVESRAEIVVLKQDLAQARQELDHCRKAHSTLPDSSASRGSGTPSSQRETHLRILATEPSSSDTWQRSWQSVQENLLVYIDTGLITSDLAIPLPIAPLPLPGDRLDVRGALQTFADASGPGLALFLGNGNTPFLPAVRDFQQPSEAFTKDTNFHALAKRLLLGRSSVRYVPGPIYDIVDTTTFGQPTVPRPIQIEAARRWKSASAVTDPSIPPSHKLSISTIRVAGKVMVFIVNLQDYEVMLFTSVEDKVEDHFVKQVSTIPLHQLELFVSIDHIADHLSVDAVSSRRRRPQ